MHKFIFIFFCADRSELVIVFWHAAIPGKSPGGSFLAQILPSCFAVRTQFQVFWHVPGKLGILITGRSRG